MDTSLLHDYERFIKSLKNFEWLLGGSLPGGMDLDFMCERNGNYLVLESKPMVGDWLTLPLGQAIALQRMATLPMFSVWLLGEHESGFREAGAYLLDMAELSRPHGPGPVLLHRDRFEFLTSSGVRDRASAWWHESSGERAA